MHYLWSIDTKTEINFLCRYLISAKSRYTNKITLLFAYIMRIPSFGCEYNRTEPNSERLLSITHIL